MSKLSRAHCTWLIAGCVVVGACGGQTRGTGRSTEAPRPDAATPLGDGAGPHPDVNASEYISVATEVFCDSVAPCCDKMELSLDAESCKAFAGYSLSRRLRPFTLAGEGLVPRRCLP